MSVRVLHVMQRHTLGGASRSLLSLASHPSSMVVARHVIASLVHLSHGWGITTFFLVAAAVQVVAAGRVARGAGRDRRCGASLWRPSILPESWRWRGDAGGARFR